MHFILIVLAMCRHKHAAFTEISISVVDGEISECLTLDIYLIHSLSWLSMQTLYDWLLSLHIQWKLQLWCGYVVSNAVLFINQTTVEWPSIKSIEIATEWSCSTSSQQKTLIIRVVAAVTFLCVLFCYKS